MDWLNDNQIQVLNVAGNRESVFPGVGKRTEEFLILSLGALPVAEVK